MECNIRDSSDCSDFSDEDLGMLKRALHVQIPPNFDPSKIPQNGEEYLQQVMYEAKQCPAFAVAPVRIDKSKQLVEVQVREKCMKAPSTMLPSVSWQEDAVEDFTKFRLFIFKKLETHPKAKTITPCEVLATAPTLSIVARLLQDDKINLLESILQQLNEVRAGESLSKTTAIWVYALLATLDTPLCPDTCHVLRELARACSRIRSALSSTASESDYKPLNLYVCLIARFFRQLDLADE